MKRLHLVAEVAHSPSCSRSSPRRAAVTVMVLVVLLLMALLVAQYVRRAVGDRRQMRQEFMSMQTQHLADAGELRAHAAIRATTEYTGETWQVPAGTIHQTNTGTVVITVADGWATVVARYPSNEDLPLQVTRKIKVQQ